MKTISTILFSSLLLACGPKKSPSNTSSATEESTATEEASTTEASSTEESTNTAEEENASDTKEPATPVGPILGALDKSLIDAAIQEAMPFIKTCYQNELTNNPTLAGKLHIKLVIGKDGTVSSTEPKQDKTTLDSPKVIECVSAEIMKIVFPEPTGGGIVIVSYPFSFQP